MEITIVRGTLETEHLYVSNTPLLLSIAEPIISRMGLYTIFYCTCCTRRVVIYQICRYQIRTKRKRVERSVLHVGC